MPSHYSSIGFGFESEEEFRDVTRRLSADAEPLVTKQGSYLRCTSASGAELWLQVSRKNQLIGAHPHYRGETSLRVRITARVRRDDNTELDGAFHAWANPEPASGDGDYPFLFDCANFDEMAGVALPAEGSVQIAAFAHELSYYDSPEQFAASQDREMKIASQSFIPSGLFTDKNEQPAALALFTGHVQRAERKVNDLYGGEFLWAAIETYGGTFDLVADPSLLPVTPAAGSVLSGTFWLSGHVRALTSKANWARKLLHAVRS